MEDFEKSIGKVVLDKNSMSYSLVSLLGKNALIQVVATNGITKGFEVWKIRIRPLNSKAPGHVWFPSNEDFGKYGWYYPNKEQALCKFKELTTNE